ncbi:MAG: hypothetical protein IT581_06535 [Verrucomicrobiales bacterium]|nr:hypothetical protein [Verrucomicrobiales bacterium]
MSEPIRKLIIGLIGVHRAKHVLTTKRAGKDTVGKLMIDELRTKYGVSARRVGFADELYKEVAQSFGVPVSFIIEHKEVFRTLLQQWGTEIRRGLWGADYWIKKANQVITECPEPIVIITDVRLQNEIEFINGAGGRLVRVLRVSEEHIDGGDSGHQSERFATCDFSSAHCILNTEGIKELKANTSEYLRFIIGEIKYRGFPKLPPPPPLGASDGR